MKTESSPASEKSTIATKYVALLILVAPAGFAKGLHWASRGDVQTFDPYSFNENLNNTISTMVYDTLVMRDKQLQVVPGLATSWTPDAAT